MANDYIEALNKRFTNIATKGREKPDDLTRDIGGRRNNQPFISGYFQAFFEVPEALFGSASDAPKWLHSTCENFTPPATALNKTDLMGVGQVGASFPTSVTTTREFTLSFREYQNLPLLNIFKIWGGIFDPYVGVSTLKGKEFIPANYKGNVYVILLKPTGAKKGYSFTADDIEDFYAFTGVFPTNIPTDVPSGDITANDMIQYSITFSFDGHPLTRLNKTLETRMLSFLNGTAGYMKTYEHFASYMQGNSIFNPGSTSEPDAKNVK